MCPILAWTIRVLALAFVLSACSSTGETSTAKIMPAEFESASIEYDSDKPFETIQRRLSKSQCGKESADISSLGLLAGMSTRPGGSASVFVETGDHPDGSRWYVLRETRNPALALCGVKLSVQDQGTEVTVIGLRQKNLEAIAKAVDSGTFFCRCEALSK